MNDTTYNKMSRREINLYSASYDIFGDIRCRYSPSPNAYSPKRLAENRRHTNCTDCEHLWLTEEDHKQVSEQIRKARNSGVFEDIFLALSMLQDGIVLLAKFKGKKAGYCLLGEWTVAGTDGPNKEDREIIVRNRLRGSLSEQRIFVGTMFVAFMICLIAAFKVEVVIFRLLFSSLSIAAIFTSLLYFVLSVRTRSELKEI